MNKINNSFISSIISCPDCSFEKRVKLYQIEHGSIIKCPTHGCNKQFPFHNNCIFDTQQYSEISPDAFMHKLDKQAISALRKIPGIDFVLRKMMQFGYEKIIRINAMADDVKVTTKTCSYIYDMAVQSSKCIGISLPDIYINQNPIPNAFTIGIEYPIITIHSGLIDLLNEDELYSVICHEMTHIKCHHVLYHMLAEFLVGASSMLGLAGSLILPLKLGLLEWSRKAELTADRGALIISNNKNATIKLLMKLAGGSAKLTTMIDEREFVTQAEQYEKITSGISLNKFYKFASTIERSHPFPVLRAYEINNWAESEEYKSIFSGKYIKRSADTTSELIQVLNCPHCGEKVDIKATYCEKCGQNPNSLENQYDKSGYQIFSKNVKGGFDAIMTAFGQNDAEVKTILNTDQLFCEIALDLGYINQKDCKKALDEQNVDLAVGENRIISEYLSKNGCLSKEQVIRVQKMLEKIKH